jgi:hypothetical protein
MPIVRALALRHCLLIALSLVGCGGASRGSNTQCTYGEHVYDSGQNFPARDGCNTCSCDDDGRVSCTLLACETCDSVQSRYAAAIEEAKTCDPQRSDQCSKLVTEGLACGCQTFVSVEESAALTRAIAAQQQYESMACGEGIVCGPCLTLVSSFCSAQGRCEPLFAGGDAACKVNGVIYKSGASGIQDPVSCNQCQCDDGQLGCTEIGCSVDCPPDTAYGTQCAQCSPLDDCEVVEHACLPTCSDACEQGVCLDHLCRRVCG